MTGKTHQIFGTTVGLTYYLASTNITYNPATFGAVLAFSFLGALLPDIDSGAGEIWHYIPFGHTAGRVVDPFLKHRNLTHSIAGIILIGIGAYILFSNFPNYWGINQHLVYYCFMLGYFSHLLADMFTVEGIPLLFPLKYSFGIPPKPFQGIRIETGKWFENLIIFPTINLWLILLVVANWQNLKALLFK